MSVTTDIILESLTKLSAQDKLRRWCGRDTAAPPAPVVNAAEVAVVVVVVIARGETSGTRVIPAMVRAVASLVVLVVPWNNKEEEADKDRAAAALPSQRLRVWSGSVPNPRGRVACLLLGHPSNVFFLW